MSKKGLLKFEDFGWMMPVTNPVICRPPYYARDIESLTVTFETDAEAAAAMLPDKLEFADEKPVANLTIANMRFSNMGTFMEASLTYNVLYNGKPYQYYPYLLVDGNEAPMLMGRELFGNQKKVAKITMKKERNFVVATVRRPDDILLAEVMITLDRNIPSEELAGCDVCNIKLIPSCEEGKGPEVCQLVGQSNTSTPVIGSDGMTEVFGGLGSITWGMESNEDPWYRNKVNRVISASFGRYNYYVPYGYIMYDYLKER